MPEPRTTSTPTTLWLTDRSRFKLGTSRCQRARYLGYHFGPTGYGITARRDALPLATGLGFHQGFEAMGRVMAQHDRLPDLHETRAIIAEHTAAYVARVEARGYRGILGGPQTEETIREQRTLIEAMLWTARMKVLPFLHERYQVRHVEEERLHFLACSCGAPPLDQAEHIRRGCTGQALMLRTDMLALRRGGSTFAYFECKTTGWESEAWAEQWETDPQLALGTLDAAQLYGAEVTELYIVGLNKGRRQKDRYDPEQPKRQMSPLVYGYRRPSNPPLLAEDWLPAYEWVTNDGETKRASRAHKRTGIWHLDEGDWPTYRAYKAHDADLTPVEFWVRLMLPDSLLDKACFVLGPMNRQDAQLRSLLNGFRGEERRWQEVLWALYELQQQGHAWESDVFQGWLDQEVPCSWACRPFGKEHQCEFVPICHRHQGWQDPLANGYQPRLPHHDPELQQAISRGLLPEAAADLEEGEE